ncbi:MAG: TraB/GumN family protein [Treponema sp.]|jgi:pheromone shutdown-related protein TraB|nr:TraB/GumN family protein [Treponema sp.]
MGQTEKYLQLNGREIILIGTAHISKESISEVTAAIKNETPDTVAIELDEKRLESLTNPDSWRKLDIISILRHKQGFLMLANLVLSSFQRRMGSSVSVKPGDEMKAAYETSKELGIQTVMVDRPIQITLRRAWAMNSFFGKMKLLATLFSSIFNTEDVSAQEIENLKKSNEMDSMMNELADYLPAVKKVLIDERDRYLATRIWTAPGTKIIAVLGAGHLPGVQAHLAGLSAGTEDSDVTDIAAVPSKKKGSAVIGWIIPVLIIALIVLGFYFGGKNQGKSMVGMWIVWNGALAAVGTVLAGGHPLTILAAFFGAPVTSLCPLVGVGIVTGIVQAFICKPKVADMESLQQDAGTVKGFYHNRILRVLLVFFLSSLGSSIGTFVAGASFVTQIGSFFSGLIK